ncbi:glycosyltransferase [Butyrivibrio sp. INlla16]|uniref:glycosyltransferase family protein n=1 Tax=Butyrivibrio sp. INlla16 TaxID=1520807 RepID=UPI00088AAF29|nr:glycosyltransferase [Butyrivibrio sp. INlla16]SDB60140.1 Glycosyl transferases group 1 [Butyrivibrio sp. INlla16]
MTEDQNNNLFDQSIVSVHTFIEKGFLSEAMQMIGAMEKAFPDKRADLLWEKVYVYEAESDDEEIIKLLIELFEVYHDKNAYTLLDDNYFDRFIPYSQQAYSRNKKLFKDYKFFYGESKDLPDWQVFYCGEKLIIAVNRKEKLFKGFVKNEIDFSRLSRKCTFIENIVFRDQMDLIIEKTQLVGETVGAKNAVYFAFQEWEWEVFMQIGTSYEELCDNRCFFLVGEEGVRKCYSDLETEFPAEHICTCNYESSLYRYVDEIIFDYYKEYDGAKQRIQDYYSDEAAKKESEIRIREKKPRILFWTSRFTTVLQYHCKNTMDAAINCGCECRLLKESDDAKRLTMFKIAKVMDEFRPDVIFILDHFRFENGREFPNNIFYVTWIQDPMPHIMDPSSNSKLIKRDILLNHLFTYKVLADIYGERLIDAPVPANPNIYKPYEISEEEKQKYSADICFVCHASDVNVWIEETVGRFNMDEKTQNIFRLIFDKYEKMAYMGEFLYSEEEFRIFIRDGFDEQGYVLNESAVNLMANETYTWFNQRVFRQVLVDWILEAGFDNIKLWGNGWKTNPKYEKYAMGPAENGEVLSKIYQSSKIVMGNNIVTTAAARAWESMLSGAFYLSNYIPPEHDWCDIHKIMPEGTVEYFRSKEELIDKLHYFLEHEDERKAVATKCKEGALQRMTFEALMKKLLDILPEYL